MSRPLKRGTIIKTIWLTGDTHEIDCRRDGIKRLGFRAEFGRERSNMSYDLYRSNATALEHATMNGILPIAGRLTSIWQGLGPDGKERGGHGRACAHQSKPQGCPKARAR